MRAATHTRFFQLGSPAAPVRLRDGGLLPGITVAYETWGELDAACSNAILVFHALSGSHHAAGFNPALPEVGDFWQPELHEGWWDVMIGPRKALDTRKYFVICANYLGGCYGSSGPASLMRAPSPGPDGTSAWQAWPQPRPCCGAGHSPAGRRSMIRTMASPKTSMRSASGATSSAPNSACCTGLAA